MASIGPYARPVRQLIQRPAMVADRRTTVRQAAVTMGREGISALLIGDGDGVWRQESGGIVTDRDLRNRVVAEGKDGGGPVREVMSRPAVTVSADASLYEALLIFLRSRVHHLPVVEGGRAIGLITHGDLVRHQTQSPAYLLERIDHSTDPETLSGYPEELASLVDTLVTGGLDPVDVGRIVATLNDALVVRCLREAVKRLGTPPTRFQWIVFGSEGRREQTLITDQDNALVYDGDSDEARSYVADLAKEVVGSMERASFPPCLGGFMATRWHHPLSKWVELFRRWGRAPDPQAVLQASNLFDWRPLFGELDLEVLEEVVASVAARPIFMAHMTRVAVRLRPPLGWFRRLREGEDGIDLKAVGLLPIVGLARIYALEASARQGSTLERLAAAVEAKVLTAAAADDLAESYRFIFRLQLRHQLAARRGDPAHGAHLRIATLRADERRRLEESFRILRRMQDAIAHRYEVDALG